MRSMFVGGAAVPQSLIEAFEQRHGLRVVHAWGMTETAPLGTISHVPVELPTRRTRREFEARAKQGRPSPFVEIRAAQRERARRRGTARRWASSRCAGRGWRRRTTTATTASDRFTDDGWFRTGDIVTIDARGTVSLQDRAKDLIKSGGEWISSVALESALMGHPAVAEAAVIAVRVREMERAAAGRRRPEARRRRHARRAARVSRAAVPEVLAAGRLRVCRRHPADIGGQVSEGRAQETFQGPRGRVKLSEFEIVFLRVFVPSWLHSLTGGPIYFAMPFAHEYIEYVLNENFEDAKRVLSGAADGDSLRASGHAGRSRDRDGRRRARASRWRSTRSPSRTSRASSYDGTLRGSLLLHRAAASSTPAATTSRAGSTRRAAATTST